MCGGNIRLEGGAINGQVNWHILREPVLLTVISDSDEINFTCCRLFDKNTITQLNQKL